MPRDVPSAPAARGLARRWAGALVTAGLLLGLGVFGKPLRVDAQQVADYHARARASVDSLPYTVGDWIGRDVETPEAAIDILQPNILVNRRYENVITREVADLLIVQCADARDLAGHFPPVCYPAHGMLLGTAIARDWRVGDVDIGGMRYTFKNSSVAVDAEIVIDNFMVLPTSRFARDMDVVYAITKDRRLRQFGAGQVQVMTAGAMSAERRDEVFTELVADALPLLRLLTREVERDG